MPMSREPSLDRAALLDRYRAVRARTERLCSTLAVEDYQLQSMPDCSPPKWHLAHTTWFFEEFALSRRPDFRPFDERYRFLFNSYYNAVGARWPRPARGLLSRPTVADVFRYRRSVDERMSALLETADEKTLQEAAPIVELGHNHEEQHQELLLSDLKHAFGLNPLRPAYAPPTDAVAARAAAALKWLSVLPGMKRIGHVGRGFAFDNEGPAHDVYLQGFEIARRPVTNGEYLAFLDDDGYGRPEFWLSDGWNVRCREGWTLPLYWERQEKSWSSFTLRGDRPLDPSEPVSHISFYEADAFARWAGARLPTEAEWESIASKWEPMGNFLDSERFHPAPADDSLYGDVWVWTASPYVAYPGYRPAAGALGEYNGKFMCNQIVLRGGSCATPARHVRATYRNFFPPDARWQFTGLRLAKDLTA
jgi:ergothioneine biosynthesis protein EgtB